MKIFTQHIVSPQSNPLLHRRFSSRIPKPFSKCVGVCVVLEFNDVNDKLNLATDGKDVQSPIGMLSVSFNGRNTATLHVPITLEPILFDGAMDYDIEAPLEMSGEICGHFVNYLSLQNLSNLSIKLVYKLV